jgi:hypothetical protein
VAVLAGGHEERARLAELATEDLMSVLVDKLRSRGQEARTETGVRLGAAHNAALAQRDGAVRRNVTECGTSTHIATEARGEQSGVLFGEKFVAFTLKLGCFGGLRVGLTWIICI